MQLGGSWGGPSILWAASCVRRIVNAESAQFLYSKRLSSIFLTLDGAGISPIGIHFILSMHTYLMFSMAAYCDLSTRASFSMISVIVANTAWWAFTVRRESCSAHFLCMNIHSQFNSILRLLSVGGWNMCLLVQSSGATKNYWSYNLDLSWASVAQGSAEGRQRVSVTATIRPGSDILCV